MDHTEHSLMTESTSRRIELPSTRYQIGEELKKLGTVNNHSSFGYVNILKEILGDSLFSKLKNTFLGPIITAALRKGGGAQSGDGLGFSGKLVHFLISRQILTTRKNELWFYFNCQPMRFSLREFHLVTGLPCWKTEEEEVQIEGKFKWPLCKGKHTLKELIAQIKALGEDAEEGKLRLAMLVLVESIFLLKYSCAKSTFLGKYLDIAKKNIESYPWGKDSFDLLIDSVNEVKSDALKIDLKGFPMALHLWFLASVPKLQAVFAPRLETKHSDWFICARYLSTQQAVSAQIWCEESNDAKVTCVLSSFNDAADLSVLLDEENDDDLDKVMDLVNRGYKLTEFDWRRKFIELEKTEEFISQMHQEDQFQGQEVEFDVGGYVSPRLETCVLPRLEAPTCHLSEVVDDWSDKAQTLDKDVGDQSDAMVEELQQLNFQDGESSVGEPLEGEINTSSTTPPRRTRCGRVSKPVKRFTPSGKKPKKPRKL